MGQASTFGNCYSPSAPPDGALCNGTVLSASKLRPLLCGVEAHFKKMADPTGRILASMFAEVWHECAERKLGHLSLDDIQTIELGVKTYIGDKKLGPMSRINYVDFMSFLLDGTEVCVNDGSVVSRLRQVAAQGPKEFHESVLTCAMRCRSDAGEPADYTEVSVEEFTQCLEDLLPARVTCNDPGENPSPVAPRDLADNLFRVLEVPMDGRINLYDALAHILDRRKTPVELVLYDISHGASRLFSHALLGRQFEAIYHSSVLVFGTEFWYGGQVFENEPPIDPQTFGPPLADSLEQLQESVYNSDLKTVHLGSTLATLFELREFLQESMKSKYRPDNYDVLTNNCNCFSDDVVQYLTGKGIPEAVRRLPELVMSTSGAQLLRPFLNRWLCSFQTNSDGNFEQGLNEHYANADMGESEHLDDLKDDEFVAWEDAVAVVAVNGGSIDLGYFDPSESASLVRKAKRRTPIMRMESGRLCHVKTGEGVTFRSGAVDLKYADKQERKEIRRSAIRRLVDGRFVTAKLLQTF